MGIDDQRICGQMFADLHCRYSIQSERLLGVTGFVRSTKNYLSTELDITIDFIWLYIAEHRFSSKTASVYYDIFTIMSNVAYEDIVYKEFVELAMHMYLEHVTFPDLDFEILHFLRNVYFDKVGITYLGDDFLSTYVINFITRRADVYPELAAELLGNFTRFMNERGVGD